jgi:hypothetical protein
MKSLLLAMVLLFGPMLTKMNASELISVSSSEGNFQMFHGHRQGNGVGLMWAISAPTAVSFEVERSYDGEFFDSVAQMEAAASGRHRFTDNNIYPGYIHYRIKANHNDGSVEYSETVIVRIVSRK